MYVVFIAKLLSKRLRTAALDFVEHQELFEVLTASVKNQDLITLWTTQIETWEKALDKSRLEDPYLVVNAGEWLHGVLCS